jgi:hypothetical protein
MKNRSFAIRTLCTCSALLINVLSIAYASRMIFSTSRVIGPGDDIEVFSFISNPAMHLPLQVNDKDGRK